MQTERACSPGDHRRPRTVRPELGTAMLFKCSGVVPGGKRCPGCAPDVTRSWRPVSCRLVIDVWACNREEIAAFAQGKTKVVPHDG